jgi:murein DD-endopeptidase MepM/ murein hydrolase activator NlpD
MLPAFREPTASPGRGRRLRLLILLVVGFSFTALLPALPTLASVSSATRGGAEAPRDILMPVAGGEWRAPRQEPAPRRGRVPALWMPVTGPVVRGFDARAGPFGPGHRGIDILAPAGALVGAPATGRVGFAGPVAGTAWVSLVVAPGVLVTLGPLLDRAVTPGQRLRALATVGRLRPGHGAGGATLHMSARVDGMYVDPLPYLVDRPRPRLAPLIDPGGLPGT